MKRKFRLTIRVLLFVGLTVLGIRLLIIASHAETGFETLGKAVRYASIEWLPGTQPEITAQHPDKQAEFWIAETKRVVELHPDDADVAMGAAIVLNASGAEYQERLWEEKWMSMHPGNAFASHESTLEIIWAAKRSFEDQTSSMKQKLSAISTDTASNQLNLWRLRAILNFPRTGEHAKPFDPSWLKELQECAQHDDQNALYDYLAADYLWAHSVTLDWSDDLDIAEIQDLPRYQNGIEFFERGQSKTHLSFPTRYSELNEAFLAKTRVSFGVRQSLSNHRDIELDGMTRLRSVNYFLDAWNSQALAAENTASVLEIQKQRMRIVDQLQVEKLGKLLSHQRSIMKDQSALWYAEMVDDYPEKFTQSETETAQDALLAAETENLVFESCQQRFNARQNAVYYPNRSRWHELPGEAARLLGLALLVCLVASLTSRLLKTNPKTRDPSSRLGDSPGFEPSKTVAIAKTAGLGTKPGPNTDCKKFEEGTAPCGKFWIVAVGFKLLGKASSILLLVLSLGITIFLFGLAPAGVIPQLAQQWLSTTILLSIPTVIVTAIAFRILKARRFKFSLRLVMLAITCVAILLGSQIGLKINPLEGLPFDLAFERPRFVEFLANQTRGKAHTWLAVFVLWFYYGGAYFTIALWGISMFCLAFATSKRQVNDDQNTCASRRLKERIADSLGSVVKPMFTFALLALIAFLIIAGISIEKIEKTYQTDIAHARHPEREIQEWNAMLEETMSDETTMEEYRVFAADKLAEESADD